MTTPKKSPLERGGATRRGVSPGNSSDPAPFLLTHFDRLAEAPGGIAKLRALVMQLAVHGKITKQDKGAEPPENWKRVTVPEVGEQRLGKMLDKQKNRGELKRYLRNINVRWSDFDLSDVFEMRFEEDELDEFRLAKGDVLICEGGYPGRAAVWEGQESEMYFQKAIHRVRLGKLVDPYFFALCLRADYDTGRLADFYTGTGIKHFTGRSLSIYTFPLPPLAEQRRIVAKVEELMGLCDALEAAQQDRETVRTRLRASALHQFASPDSDSKSAAFVLKQLTEFTTVPEDLELLRKSILQLAVQGQLATRVRNEGEALAALHAEGVKILNDDDAPSIPNHWAWVELGSLMTVMNSGWSPDCPSQPAASGKWGVLKTTAVQPLVYLEEQNKALPPNLTERPEHEVKAGDILFTRAGPMNRVGISCVADKTRSKLMISDKIIRFQLRKIANPKFTALCLNAGYSSETIESLKSGMAASQVNISQVKLKTVPIPLPPLAEQRRIVAKVDELMAMLAALEATLTTARTTAENLLAATVARLHAARLHAA